MIYDHLGKAFKYIPFLRLISILVSKKVQIPINHVFLLVMIQNMGLSAVLSVMDQYQLLSDELR